MDAQVIWQIQVVSSDCSGQMLYMWPAHRVIALHSICTFSEQLYSFVPFPHARVSILKGGFNIEKEVPISKRGQSLADI